MMWIRSGYILVTAILAGWLGLSAPSYAFGSHAVVVECAPVVGSVGLVWVEGTADTGLVSSVEIVNSMPVLPGEWSQTLDQVQGALATGCQEARMNRQVELTLLMILAATGWLSIPRSRSAKTLAGQAPAGQG